MSDLPPGTVFAGHRIEAVVGRGGMGVVYRATQLDLERTVALKLVAPELLEDETARRRFLQESKLAASIDHPHVIPIRYAGEEAGVPYLAMRYVTGDDAQPRAAGRAAGACAVGADRRAGRRRARRGPRRRARASRPRFYAQARRCGMAAAPSRALLRAWLRRVLAGYWTHAGCLNWDTGLGFRRWHQAKKLGLSQHGLIGIASAPELADRRTRAWAKWILDRGFAFYERQAECGGGIAPGVFFGLTVKPQSLGSTRLAAARIVGNPARAVAGNPARAVAGGLGTAPAAEPPALYAYDPDSGRLAITTPEHNTAVVPVSRRAFPYGGIELARLFDGRQEVAAGIGGRPPAAFGLLVRDASGRRLLATQVPRPDARSRRVAAATHAGARRGRGEHLGATRVRRAVPRPARERRRAVADARRPHEPPLYAALR